MTNTHDINEPDRTQPVRDTDNYYARTRWAKSWRILLREPAAGAVLDALVIYVRRESGLAWPSNRTLAANARCTVRTVARSLKSLEKHGFIAHEGTDPRSSTIMWRVAGFPSWECTPMKEQIDRHVNLGHQAAALVAIPDINERRKREEQADYLHRLFVDCPQCDLLGPLTPAKTPPDTVSGASRGELFSGLSLGREGSPRDTSPRTRCHTPPGTMSHPPGHHVRQSEEDPKSYPESEQGRDARARTPAPAAKSPQQLQERGAGTPKPRELAEVGIRNLIKDFRGRASPETIREIIANAPQDGIPISYPAVKSYIDGHPALGRM